MTASGERVVRLLLRSGVGRATDTIVADVNFGTELGTKRLLVRHAALTVLNRAVPTTYALLTFGRAHKTSRPCCASRG